MSVVLIIRIPNNEDKAYPLATESTWLNVWVPIIKKLQLKWIADGMVCGHEDIDKVIAELKIICAYTPKTFFERIINRMRFHHSEFEFVKQRIISLIEILENEKNNCRECTISII